LFTAFKIPERDSNGQKRDKSRESGMQTNADECDHKEHLAPACHDGMSGRLPRTRTPSEAEGRDAEIAIPFLIVHQ